MPFIPAIGTKGNLIPPRYHPNSRGKQFFPCALLGPVTEANPSAHFLAEAHRRTLRCLPGRLAAGDRPSLLAADAQNFLISAFVITIYNIPSRKMQEGIFLFAAENGIFCKNSTRRNRLCCPRRADSAARGEPLREIISPAAPAARGGPRRRCPASDVCPLRRDRR